MKIFTFGKRYNQYVDLETILYFLVYYGRGTNKTGKDKTISKAMA